MGIIIKKVTAGLFAHVDAGKTTLAESILYHTGKIKSLGRVDCKNTYLDYNAIERERGITVFSKCARLNIGDFEVTLMDTPGHIDFSSEAERTVQVLDYAILIISSRDGVQFHTETLWKILSKYSIPVFIFVNKMDLDGACRNALMKEICENLSDCCIDFSTEDSELYENIAVCDEQAMTDYLSKGEIEGSYISELIKNRKIYPCFFGSALKDSGIDRFISGIEKYFQYNEYPDAFSAKIYKISRDKQGNRLTYMKITGGLLNVKDIISYYVHGQEEIIQEKINSIRFYSGEKFESKTSAGAGDICAVTGLTKTYAGQGIGADTTELSPVLEPVISYEILLPDGMDSVSFMPVIKQLEEEDPLLKISLNPKSKRISIYLMGSIQAEIIKKIIHDRFDVDIDFGNGGVLYKETIATPVEGIGHFEPLRHYAEVHLLIEPASPGSGITVKSDCSESVLDKNWQHLIMTHIAEKTHKGVLIGAPLTDVTITVIAGRAHVKHTEGGDFRQATYRAIRQGLMKADGIILEPYYSYKLSVPSSNVGTALNDIKNMGGTILTNVSDGAYSVITGKAPVKGMQNYYENVISYTRGVGRLSYVSDGYMPCHDQAKIIQKYNYNAEEDPENTPDSVFCSHGSGMVVKWSEVEKYMHVSSGIVLNGNKGIPSFSGVKLFKNNLDIDDKELESIMDREFGPIKRRQYAQDAEICFNDSKYVEKPEKSYCIIIDGYNLMFSFMNGETSESNSLDLNRHLLTEMISNYNGFVNNKIVLVFDGYKVNGSPGEKYDYNGINVVYTKENETADMYIERLIDEIGKNYYVKVVTSDNMIRVSALKSGVLRISSSEFIEEMSEVGDKINEIVAKYGKNSGFKPFKNING